MAGRRWNTKRALNNADGVFDAMTVVLLTRKKCAEAEDVADDYDTRAAIMR